ncbi:MAG: cysteine dioxygenase [Gammaproteobacteria bacterium]|nr:cysteine dioxygenase [Gammaproteobacteria bacterium]
MAIAGDGIPRAAGLQAARMGWNECLDEPLFASYVASLDELVEADDAWLPGRVAAEVCKLVNGRDWLPEACCEPGDESYRRHLLYADPAGRFTVLAVVWRPGQGTPIHGHTAWGAVGVYRGHPSVATYCYQEGQTPVPTGEHYCRPGEVCHVEAGVAAPHRVFNESDDVAITIHTYGRDLTIDPAAINILL